MHSCIMIIYVNWIWIIYKTTEKPIWTLCIYYIIWGGDGGIYFRIIYIRKCNLNYIPMADKTRIKTRLIWIVAGVVILV